jgi:hypothetical protein
MFVCSCPWACAGNELVLAEIATSTCNAIVATGFIVSDPAITMPWQVRQIEREHGLHFDELPLT